MADLAVDVEAVGIAVLARIALGGPGEQEHAHVSGNRAAVELYRSRAPSTLDLGRGVEAEELFHSGPEETRIFSQLATCARATSPHP